ncbi:MAG: hypothetical protein EP338_14065 [Bacteroidetes bacterium]|nr:MAG: hypothetical protein EP338_14065 [Bacteroidota bacterium]
MNLKLTLSTLALFTAASLTAQFSNFNTQRNWSMNKKEILFGGGATQFLGDLGGQDGIGKDYSLADMNFSKTSYNFLLGYRYRFHPVLAVTGTFNFGQFKASDEETDNPARHLRKIEVRSILLNLTARLEYIVYQNEKVGKRNNLPGLKGMKDKNVQVFVFTGIGGAYFNPKGFFPSDRFVITDDGQQVFGTDEWVSLQPLRTEGQGYPGGSDKYRRVTATIPFGFGYRLGINRMWRIMIDATYFKTFTDYMDDVSTVYYDYEQNGITASPSQIYHADPSWNGIFGDGQQRGDNEKDAFFYLNVGVTKNVTYKSYVRGKPIKWKGVRAKF